MPQVVEVAVATGETPQTRLEIIFVCCISFHLLVCFAPNGTFIWAGGQWACQAAGEGWGLWVLLVVQLQLKQQQRPRLIYGQRAFLECFVAKNPLGTPPPPPPLAHAPAWAVAHPVVAVAVERRGKGQRVRLT